MKNKFYLLLILVLCFNLSSCMTLLIKASDAATEKRKEEEKINKEETCKNETQKFINKYHFDTLTTIPEQKQENGPTYFFDIEYGMSHEEVYSRLSSSIRNCVYEDLEKKIYNLCVSNYRKNNSGNGYVSTYDIDKTLSKWDETDVRTTKMTGKIPYGGLNNWNVTFTFFDDKLESINLERKKEDADTITLIDIMNSIKQKYNIEYEQYSTYFDSIGSLDSISMNYTRYKFLDKNKRLLFKAYTLSTASLSPLYFSTEYKFEYNNARLERYWLNNSIKQQKEAAKQKQMEGGV